MNLRTLAVSAIAVALLFGFGQLTAEAGSVLDQSHMPNPADGALVIGTHTSWSAFGAQTFQVGMSGDLDRVDVLVRRDKTSATQPLVLDIRTTVSGAPSLGDNLSGANILAHASLSAAGIPLQTPGWVTFDLSGAPASVTTGDVLAIVLRSADTNHYSWLSGSVPGYSSGSNWFKAAGETSWSPMPVVGRDFGFKTWVSAPSTVPLPAGGLLGLGLLGGLAAVRLLRRRK